MEFDKSRVYTALNADELPIGSKCIFADTVKALRKKVQADDYAQYVQPFIRLHDNGYDVQFLADCYTYNYAYLIEPTSKSKYKPFENLKQLIVATEKHGETVKSIAGQKESTIIGMTLNNRVIIDKSFLQSFGQPYGDKVSCTTEELLYNFVFLSDNSPCGELMEE